MKIPKPEGYEIMVKDSSPTPTAVTGATWASLQTPYTPKNAKELRDEARAATGIYPDKPDAPKQ